MATTLPGVRAFVFDAYGTLFDYASAAASCRDVLGDRHGPLTALWRDKQLQYSWLRALRADTQISGRSRARRSILRWRRSGSMIRLCGCG